MEPEVSTYFATIGRKGGESKSAAKSAASRTNGKLGGRPRKNKAPKPPAVWPADAVRRFAHLLLPVSKLEKGKQS
jgi:hypothetical protein